MMSIEQELDLFSKRIFSAKQYAEWAESNGNEWAKRLAQRTIKALEVRIDDIMYNRRNESRKAEPVLGNNDGWGVLLVAITLLAMVYLGTMADPSPQSDPEHSFTRGSVR